MAVCLLCGCIHFTDYQSESRSQPLESKTSSSVATKQQEDEIRALIEQLVFADGEATNQPVLSPGVRNHTEEYRKRFETCLNAFRKLYEFKELALPIMIEHLDDKRQSINFRNHNLGNSVGDACYWNIYFQLQDRPRDYSRYGYSRTGRDGQDHVKPYWEGTPFDESGGLKQWMEENSKLSYTEMQTKCLNWLLEKEKAIGAPDADSYFLNILPLEIRIHRRKLELGEKVEPELKRLQKIRDERLTSEIPHELIPDQ